MKIEEFELEKDWKEKIDYQKLQRAIIESAIREYKNAIAKGNEDLDQYKKEELENYINEELAPMVGAKKGELQKKYIMQEIARIAGTIKEIKKRKAIQNLVEYITAYHKEWEQKSR